MPLILEGIVTTTNDDGSTNIAPMGPIVDAVMTRITLRPFQTSTTYRNLKQRPWGVLHVVDDVLLIARAALHRLDESPALQPAEQVDGRVLADCCRWYEFDVVGIDDSEQRTEIDARIVHHGRRRDFFGFNRAKHAVLEATILATRLHLIDCEEIEQQLEPLRVIVEKTAGDQEREAFALVEEAIRQAQDESAIENDVKSR